jgi:hypothetical protein
MKQEEPSRLVAMITDQLHKEAKAYAALQGVTLRELVERALEAYLSSKASTPKGKPSGEVLVDNPLTAPPKETSPETENAFALLLEKEAERAKAEHERRVAAGIIKG